MNTQVRVTVPSRLHFGLLRFFQEDGPSFGGLGMMIERPQLVVEVGPADTWTAEGPLSERALTLAQKVLPTFRQHPTNALHIRVVESPPAHTGLGSGTQLSLTLALAISTLCEEPPQDITELAQRTGRGSRSAVGSYGFQLGGMIWETGRLPNQTLGELACRLAVPHHWRVLLIAPRNRHGMFGPQESSAFEKLPPIPDGVTQQLQEIAEAEILPAVETEDFTTFADAVFRYGHLAGNCFAPVQGGPYASTQTTARIERLHRLGVRGVGQSSWGPTIFAFAPDVDQASHLVHRLQSLPEFEDTEVSLTSPDNQGAQLEHSPQVQT